MKTHKYLVTQKTELRDIALKVLQGKKVEMSEALRQKITRAQYAHDQSLALRQIKFEPWKIRREIAKRVADEYGVSLSHAYLIYYDACELYGAEEPLNSKEINYKLLLESIEDDLENARQDADHRAVAALTKTKLDALKNMPDFDKSKIADMSFSPIRYDFSPEQLNSKVLKSPKQLDELEARLLNSLASGKTPQSIKQEMIETLEEAEYEDVTNAE
jgi:hypothetical protein